MRFCPVAAKYEKTGALKHKTDGIYCYPDSTWVTREGSKTKQEAVERRLRKQRPQQAAPDDGRDKPPHVASTMLLELAEETVLDESTRREKAEPGEDEEVEKLQAALGDGGQWRKS